MPPRASEALADYVCDGVNDEVEINTALAANKHVLLAGFTANVVNPITPLSGTTLRGLGMNVTTIVGATPGGISAIISKTGSVASPLHDIVIQDLCIDGSAVSPGAYGRGYKGIDIKYCNRIQVRNVSVTGTYATGIATDFAVDCWIDGCLVDGAGRGYPGPDASGNPLGSNGIGIGTGYHPTNRIVVSNCITINCGDNGILFEVQPTPTSNGADILVIGCIIQGNGYGGFRDSGDHRVVLQGCSITNNTRNGVVLNVAKFSSDSPAQVIIDGCHISENGEHGIALDDIGGRISVIDSHIVSNGQSGIYLAAGSGSGDDLKVLNNLIADNSAYGVDLHRAVTRFDLRGNTISGNVMAPAHTTMDQTSFLIRDNIDQGTRLLGPQRF